jgi:hypothetical protein
VRAGYQPGREAASAASFFAAGGQPLSGALAIDAAPARRSRYVDPPQPGNAEWFAIETEKSRFATLLCGRDPTPEEAAEHRANIKAIRDAHR